MTDGLTDRQRDVLALLDSGATTQEIADELGITKSTVSDHRASIRDAGVSLSVDNETGRWAVANEADTSESEATDDTTDFGLSAIELGEEPDESELTDRERVLVSELQQGTTVDELTDELNSRPEVVTAHLKELKRSGWQVYIDDSTDMVAIEGDHVLRSSEHTGTRTRKANRWWELRHNKLVREFRGLQTPQSEQSTHSDNEDWILHMTDLHAGDRVRDDDGNVVYSTDDIPKVIDHITEKSLSLADKHGSEYDTGHILHGGDFVTNSGIYEGQFEDLDAWLDEQHESLMNPLVRQIKAFSERFETVNVVCQVGNHGEHRASGTSKQANADLILYKSIRNTIAHLQDHAGMLDNVSFQIGQATPYKNFELRGGKLRGHLRHGQHRRPQAETSARKKEWLSTLHQHDFDVGFMGHYHVSGRIPWDGPPILCTSSPKPAGEFVEKIGESVKHGEQGVATACGVSDDGLTAVFPIDTRGY